MNSNDARTRRLPHFLVIGAMKAGSTTLYEDLRSAESIFVPMKELRNLTSDSVLTARGRRRYERMFSPAKPGELTGEASAWYAMLPDWPGVATRARAVLGDDFRVIYIVRNPIDRLVSHHRHDLARGVTEISQIDVAVREWPRLLNYSRYHYQLEPWVDVVGAPNVRVVKFEDYVADRDEGVRSLLAFLGVPSADLVHRALDRVHNATESSPVARGLTHKMLDTQLYRRVLHRWVPSAARRIGKRLVLAPAPMRPSPPTPATVEFIIETVGPDLDRLQLLGLDLPQLWDLDETRRRYQRAHDEHMTRDPY